MDSDNFWSVVWNALLFFYHKSTIKQSIPHSKSFMVLLTGQSFFEARMKTSETYIFTLLYMGHMTSEIRCCNVGLLAFICLHRWGRWTVSQIQSCVLLYIYRSPVWLFLKELEFMILRFTMVSESERALVRLSIASK